MWRYAYLNISEENKKLSLDGCAGSKIYTYDFLGIILQTPYKHCLLGQYVGYVLYEGLK